MKKEYEKVFLNEYGYYELKTKPSVQERQEEFENSYYQDSKSTYEEKYSEEERKFFQNKLEQKMMIIRKNLPQHMKKFSILDIACGEGFVLSYFHKAGMQVAGIDFSKWAVEHHNPDMLPFFIQGDCAVVLPELKQQGRSFDVINIDSALDMMLEPEGIVRMCRELLTEQGILLLKTGNGYSLLQRTLLERGKLSKEYWLDDPGHPSYFNKDGLKNLLKAEGLSCVDFYGESFIDFNLINDRTNYYEQPETGKSCYRAKIELENMFHEISPEKSLELFRILGDMGFGREIIGVFKKDGME